jgi:hypothetical protein
VEHLPGFARPDWFEVIHLYGTKSGWERLKAIVTHEDSVARTRPLLTGSPPPLATSMPTGSPAAPRRRDRDGQSTRRLLQAATIYARADPARSSSAATGRRTRCTELLQPEDPLCYPCPSSGASTRSQRPPFFRPFQFFDHTRLNHGALCIFAVQLVLIRSEPGICQLAHRWSANQFPTKGLSSRTRWCPLRKLRESEKLQSAVGSSYERMRLRGLKRCDQHFIAPQKKQNYDLRTNSRPTAISRRSCSDSLLTASFSRTDG